MFKSSKEIVAIGSPVKGLTVGLKKITDPVFSGKIIGDGVAVLPESGIICAPCGGVITQIFHTNHAFYVLNGAGLEVMVHIGLDTVELKGVGFKRLVNLNDNVEMGQPVMEVNLEYIKAQGKETVIPVLITNMEKVSKISVVNGNVNTSDKIMSVVLK